MSAQRSIVIGGGACAGLALALALRQGLGPDIPVIVADPALVLRPSRDPRATAIRVARERPKLPVVAITPNLVTGRKLSVVWGVHCVVAEDAHDQDDMVDRAGSIAFRDGFAKAGQRVIIVAGVPLRIPGTTNMVRIASVGSNRDAEM